MAVIQVFIVNVPSLDDKRSLKLGTFLMDLGFVRSKQPDADHKYICRSTRTNIRFLGLLYSPSNTCHECLGGLEHL